MVGRIAFSPDGGTITSVGTDWVFLEPDVHFWDVSSGEEVRTLKVNRHGVTSVAFSPDGKHLATDDKSSKVRVWDLASGKVILTLPGGHTRGLRFSRNGRRLAYASSISGAIRCWDLVAGTEVGAVVAHKSPVDCAAFSADGKMLASGEREGTIFLWDVSTGRVLRRLVGHSREVKAVIFSPDGGALGSWGKDATLRFWNVREGREIRTLRGSATWIPDEKRAEEEDDGEVSGIGSEISIEDLGWVTAFAFGRDGGRVALGGARGEIWMWPWGSPTVRPSIRGHRGAVRALCFSDKDTKLLSFGEDAAIRTWDPEDSTEIKSIQAHGESIGPASFSPDATLLAYGDGASELHFWDLSSGEEIRRVKGHRWGVRSIQFSPGGDKVVSRGADPRGEGGRSVLGEYAIFRVWDAVWGRELFSLWAYSGWTSSDMKGGLVDCVSFSPDGRWLASGGLAANVVVWELASGKEIHTFRGHHRPLHAVCFSPDGAALVSGSVDSTLLTWDSGLGARRSPTRQRGEGSRRVDGLWDVLAGEDAAGAQQAVVEIAELRGEAVRFLRGRLGRVTEDGTEEIERLIARVGHEEFSERERASEVLRKLGAEAAPSLRKAAMTASEPEVRQRAEVLLRPLEPPFRVYPSEQLREVRGIQILERIGTGEARLLLEDLAGGSPHALQTREAKAALERLEGRGGR